MGKYVKSRFSHMLFHLHIKYILKFCWFHLKIDTTTKRPSRFFLLCYFAENYECDVLWRTILSLCISFIWLWVLFVYLVGYSLLYIITLHIYAAANTNWCWYYVLASIFYVVYHIHIVNEYCFKLHSPS